MKIFTTVAEIRSYSRQCKLEGQHVACVPTMGYLHEGHASLITAARRSHGEVVTSIFVNPTQFGPHEDFERYPRDFDRDIETVERAGGTVVFAPSVEEMYPTKASTTITVRGVSEPFEGMFRPGHFDGVATIVARLLIAIEPDTALFGAKDYQQTLVIRRLVADLGIPTSIEVLPTVRELDGLARSSRNVYLSAKDRENASVLFRALKAAEHAVLNNERSRVAIENHMMDVLIQIQDLTIDYAAVALAGTLETPSEFLPGEKIVCLLAVRLGATRLIDNMELTIQGSP